MRGFLLLVPRKRKGQGAKTGGKCYWYLGKEGDLVRFCMENATGTPGKLGTGCGLRGFLLLVPRKRKGPGAVLYGKCDWYPRKNGDLGRKHGESATGGVGRRGIETGIS